MLKLIATTAIGALALSAAPASAKVVDLAQAGSWTAYAGTSDTGRPICGMHIGQPGAKALHIKWGNGDTFWTVMAWKPGWRIPDGTKIPVVVGFDKTRLGNAIATGYSTEGKLRNTIGDHVEFSVHGDLLKDFFKGFKDGDRMWIQFPSGTETPWFADLTGSETIGNVFTQCIRDVIKRYPPATQPYGKEPEATQPFGQEPKQLPATKYDKSA